MGGGLVADACNGSIESPGVSVAQRYKL